MSVREFTTYKGTVEQAPEHPETAATAVAALPAVEYERSALTCCPECEGRVVAARYDSYCERCGLVVSESHIDHGPTLGDVGKGQNRGGMPRVETASPYHADPMGSTFSFSYFDGKGNSLSGSQLRRVRRLEKRLRWEGDSADRFRTDALMDIKTMGRSAGLPEFVRERATKLFRDALEAGLAGGRMSYESLAAGALIVAAREAGCPHSVDVITPWARTPEERGCAGARKVRIGLGLTDSCPPVRPGAVDAVLEALNEQTDGRGGRFGNSYFEVQQVASHLMELADERSVGPGTPRLTVAAAAVYAATKLVGGVRLTQSELAEAVSPIVETTPGRVSRYNRELLAAYIERHGTDDPAVVLERDTERST
jgi:transcription initiation factor TFIIB